MKAALLCIALIVLCCGAATSQTPTATPPPASTSFTTPPESPAAAAKTGKAAALSLPPEKANPVKIVLFAKPPVIDGKLDDDVWKTAVVLKDFYQIQPGDNIAPSKPTEVLIG
jgi:hypothetical protein